MEEEETPRLRNLLCVTQTGPTAAWSFPFCSLFLLLAKASVPNFGPLSWVGNECHGSETKESKQHDEMLVAKELGTGDPGHICDGHLCALLPPGAPQVGCQGASLESLKVSLLSWLFGEQWRWSIITVLAAISP